MSNSKIYDNVDNIKSFNVSVRSVHSDEKETRIL